MSFNKPSIYILDALRTPVGSPHRGLNDFSAAQLAVAVITRLLEKNKISPTWVEEVILGNAVSAATGQNLSRQAAVLSGLPVSVPAFMVNSVCGSGLMSIILAARTILSAEKNFIIAGGTESASKLPSFYFEGKRPVIKSKQLMNALVLDGLWCSITESHMGDRAEWLSKKFHITRRAQDRYAWKSHNKAVQAQKKGKFRKEIVELLSLNKKKMKADERPRKNIDLSKLAGLPGAFKKNGVITAGNCSVPSDGAAISAIASENFIRSKKLKPLARILGYSSVAVKPAEVFTSGILATKQCLDLCGLKIKDIDLFEMNEAFACQAMLNQKKLKIPEEKMNIWGGDIALGHPLGAAGTRALVTLLYALKDQRKKRGLVCVSMGGGGGISLAVEMV